MMTISEPEAFLTEVHGTELPEGSRIALWSKPGKFSRYLTSAADASEFDGQVDVYVSTALVPSGLNSHARLKAQEALVIPGVWLDLDLNGGPEDKKHAAPNMEAAERLAHAILTPTVLVNSGHGLQAWWLFDEPWVFGSDEERRQAERVTHGWHRLHQQIASAVGIKLDSVFDLARLMRLPGTTNGKGALDVPVARLDYDGPRHAQHVIAERALPAAPAAKPTASKQPIKSIDLPQVKLDALLETNKMFRRTWEHTRHDGPSEHWTMSEYDLSLASTAVHAKWADGEIVALIQEHRQTHGDADDIAKGERHDYIRRTIETARSGSGTPQGPDEPQESDHDEHDLGSEPADDQQRDDEPTKIAAICNEYVGLRKGTRKRQGDRIIRVSEHGEGADAEYDLELENGTKIEGISLKDLYDPRAIERRITQTVKRPPPIYRTPSDWRPWATAVLQAARPDIASGTEEDELREWLSLFVEYTRENTLTNVQNVDIDDQDDLFSVLSLNTGVFRGTDHRLYVQPPLFFAYVTRDLRQKATAKELRKRLSRAGFERPNNKEGKLSARGKHRPSEPGTSIVTRGFLASKPGFKV